MGRIPDNQVGHGDEAIPNDDAAQRKATRGPLVHGVNALGEVVPLFVTSEGQRVQDTRSISLLEDILQEIKRTNFLLGQMVEVDHDIEV